jgi:hypothetical protein
MVCLTFLAWIILMECVSNEMFGKKMVSSSREGESKKRGVES